MKTLNKNFYKIGKINLKARVSVFPLKRRLFLDYVKVGMISGRASIVESLELLQVSPFVTEHYKYSFILVCLIHKIMYNVVSVIESIFVDPIT